jgi:hypothetical protein
VLANHGNPQQQACCKQYISFYRLHPSYHFLNPSTKETEKDVFF